jgi:hypothetical protein
VKRKQKKRRPGEPTRAFLDKMSRLSGMVPLGDKERTVIQAAINMRAQKGIYRDAYSPSEKNFLEAARRLALEHGQTSAVGFLFIRRRQTLRALLPTTDSRRYHDCPICGHRHTDAGTSWRSMGRNQRNKAKMRAEAAYRRKMKECARKKAADLEAQRKLAALIANRKAAAKVGIPLDEYEEAALSHPDGMGPSGNTTGGGRIVEG